MKDRFFKTWGIELMLSLTHSFAYSLGDSHLCFIKFCKTLKSHNFLNFHPILMNLSLFSVFNFNQFLKINLKMVRNSPLKLLFAHQVWLLARPSRSPDLTFGTNTVAMHPELNPIVLHLWTQWHCLALIVNIQRVPIVIYPGELPALSSLLFNRPVH